MNRPEQSHAADGQVDSVARPHQRLLAWWRDLDTDWQSVLVATALVVLAVGFDISIPA